MAVITPHERRALKMGGLTFRAVNNPFRQQLIEVLGDRGPITVQNLQRLLRAEQSVVSQHLGILRKAGVAVAVRDGKWRRYSLDQSRLEELVSIGLEIGTTQKEKEA